MKEKSLKLNATLNVIKTIMSLIFPLITFPYASRILSADGIGKVNFANSIISYFGIIASLGISTYAIRESAKVRENKTLLSKFVIEISIINLVSTVVSYLLFFVALFLVPKFRDYKVLLIICSTTILLSTLGISWLYSALEEYMYITIRTILFQFFSIILLFLFVKTKDDYIKYAAIGVFSNVGSNVLNLIHARKYITFKNIPKLNIKVHIKPILILFGSTIAVSIFTILDTSMLGFISTEIEVGYYSAASKIIRMIRDLFPAVFTVLFARLSIYKNENEVDKINNLISKTFKFIFCFSIPMAVGLYILMPDIVQIMCGNDFTPAIISARIMTPLLILSSCSGFLGGQVMLSLGMDKTYLICMICSAFLDVVLNLVFIPNYHAAGASFATLLTEFVIFIAYIVILHKRLNGLKLKKEIFIYLVSAIVMGITVFLITNLIKTIILRLITAVFSGISVYALLLFLLRSDFFIQTCSSLINKRTPTTHTEV